STHNTRIERLWREVGAQFARAWAAFFTRLGRLHLLDRRNPHHLWLLQYLFLDALNADCEAFIHEWNAHPIRGPNAQNTSPKDLLILGQTEGGVYVDDYQGVHPDVLQEFHGVEGRRLTRQPGQTGAGHSVQDMPAALLSEIADQIAESQSRNIRHPAVKVPRQSPPFDENTAATLFKPVLDTLIAEGRLPSGMYVRPDEWDEEGYPEYEEIPVGRGRSGKLRIPLPADVWLSRAELWCRAVTAMSLTAAQQAD
ncbi:hypothetical protein GGG16DRAFT_58163, partial [Schizophyllum commune]